jgi:regulator of protease activity HflC (stomatin/prohibitin superfamily)
MLSQVFDLPFAWLMLTVIIIVGLLSKTFFIVNQQTIAIVERFGKFNRVADAGLHLKIPFVEQIAGLINLRIRQLDVEIETKTKDNVFLRLQVSVQYRVREDAVYAAFYKLDSDVKQITSFVFDVVRAQVPKMILDNVFDEKESIADAVKVELTDTMQAFGYEIVKALVTDINPDEKVKHAMNEINEQQRLRMAATEKGEAEKILRVKQAEGEAESKRLQGMGVANQRKAIIDGLCTSLNQFQQSIPGTAASEVMNLVLLTQYFDTLKDIAANNKSTTILLPHSPGGHDIASQIQQGIMTGELTTNSLK